MRSEWVPTKELEHILAALMPTNALICEVSMATGLRIGDVLKLKPWQVNPDRERFTIKEEKTGKSRLVYLPKKLRESVFSQCGKYWCFENRVDPKKHRTRQAVFKDLRRAAKAFRIKNHLSPHSFRKVFAVNYYNKSGCNLEKVKKLLNHSSEAVTMIYALADVMTRGKKKG